MAPILNEAFTGGRSLQLLLYSLWSASRPGQLIAMSRIRGRRYCTVLGS